MGCGNSQVKVSPASQTLDNSNSHRDISPIIEPTDTKRGNSAGSKHSADSGFADNECDNFITENSDPDTVARIESDFFPVGDLELSISGKACPRRLSAQDKERLEEARVLAALQDEGLIARPKARATGGLRFDIVEESSEMWTRKPPARLARLEIRKTKKSREDLTEEQIRTKLAKAERRRKQKENERLEKIAVISSQSEGTGTFDNFIEARQEKDAEIKHREEMASHKRQQKLEEMKEKLKAREEYARVVRERKRARLESNEDLDTQVLPKVFDPEAPIITRTF